MIKGIYALSIALMFTVAGLSTGCGNSGDATEEHHPHEHSHYQCPMDCEEGKTYEEPGTCPVCKMDLAETENS